MKCIGVKSGRNTQALPLLYAMTIRKKMTDFWSLFHQYTHNLNEGTSISDDPTEHLNALFRHAEEQRETLEAQFNPIVSEKTPQENRSIIGQLKNGIAMTKKLLEQHEQLRNQERKLAIEMKSHLNKTDLIAQDFRTTVKRLNQITKIIDYLRCLEILFQYSEQLQNSLANQAFVECFSTYEKLIELTESIHDTSTEHLRAYSAHLTIFWYEQLKNVFASRMENLLTKMKFPYVQKLPPADLVEAFDAHRSELKEELSYVLKLRLPQRLTHPDNRSRLRFIGWKPIPLFMQMLLKSLIVRFNFHFYGEQKTNDRRKPEWYLNQVISWILDHDYFLTEQLQPLFNELDEGSTINAKVEFTRGLIELVILKLESQITSILIDTSLLTHYIEEILLFSQRLFESDIDYPKNLPNCMNFLCDEIVFEKWFQVEQDVSGMKLKRIFESTTAHQMVYERLLERNPDDIKISECAETFLTLMYAMEDRYRLVPYPSCGLRLFSLQLDLFENFLEDLKFSSDNDQNDLDPLSKRFCSILNSIVYIADVIQQWKNRPYYKRLQYFYDEYQRFVEKIASFPPVEQSLRKTIHIDSTLGQQFDLIQLTKDPTSVNVTLFDPLLQQYRDEEEQHCNNIVNHVLKVLKSRSRLYIKEKWSSMPNPKDYILMNITPSAADILLEIQTIFSNLSMNLLKNIYNEIRARIIIEYDEFLFNCIVTDQSFNEGGAAQFLFDVNRGWSRIATDHVALLFNKCRESAVLLTMPMGSALLLLDALEQETSLLSLTTLASQEASVSSPLPSPLHEMGIHHLSEFEANQVLQHRLDLTKR